MASSCSERRSTRRARGATWAPIALAGAVLAAPVASHAQSATEIGRARADALAGLQRLEAGDYDGALSKCSAAARVVAAPTVQLCVARAEVGLGHLAEAVAVYDEIVSGKAADDEPEAWKQARQEATDELGPLRKRAAQRLLLDGETALKANKLEEADKKCGAAVKVQPSAAAEVCRAKALLELRKFDDAESAALRAQTQLSKETDSDPELRSWADTLVRDARKRRVEARERDEQDQRAAVRANAKAQTLRAAGWATAGLGAAGLVTAAVGAGLVQGTYGGLVNVCSVGASCGPSQRDEIQQLDTLRLVTFVGLGIGAAGAIASTALHLSAVSARASAPRVRVGWTGLGIQIGGDF